MNSSQLAPDDAEAPPPGAPIVALLCAIALLVLSSLVRNGPLPIDVGIRDALHVGGPVPLPLDVLNVVGGALVWDPLVAVFVAALWLTGRRAEATWIGAGVLVAETVATATKLIVDRPRPPGVAVIDLVTQASFPSGHVIRVVVTGGLVALLWRAGRRTRIVAAVAVVALAVLIGLARIVAGEHWPSDVAGGYLLAATVIAGSVAVRDRLSGRVPVHLARQARVPDDEARPP